MQNNKNPTTFYSNLNPNRRLLPCALILNLALWIFTTIALGFVNEGIKEWCLNLEKQNTLLSSHCIHISLFKFNV